jgi:hypothetical protein
MEGLRGFFVQLQRGLLRTLSSWGSPANPFGTANSRHCSRIRSFHPVVERPIGDSRRSAVRLGS